MKEIQWRLSLRVNGVYMCRRLQRRSRDKDFFWCFFVVLLMVLDYVLSAEICFVSPIGRWRNIMPTMKESGSLLWYLHLKMGVRSTLVVSWITGQQVEPYRSCTRGMIHNKIHLICFGCLRPSTALECRIVVKQHSFLGKKYFVPSDIIYTPTH